MSRVVQNLMICPSPSNISATVFLLSRRSTEVATADVLHSFGDVRQWQVGQGVKHSAEMLDVVVIFVCCCESKILDFPPRALCQVVEAAMYVDVAAEDGGDGIDYTLFEVADDRRWVDAV